MTITLFDIPSKVPGKAWSPTTYRARMSLNYKGVAYETKWIEYPDIEETLKSIGGLPTSKKDDGTDYYTLPAIFDSSTGAVVTDSLKIADYLDAQYPAPEYPRLIPEGCRAAVQLVLDHDIYKTLLLPLLVLSACKNLNPTSAEFFRRTREVDFKRRLEDISPMGEKRENDWVKAKEAFSRLAAVYEMNGKGKEFFFGDVFSFMDMIIIGRLLWAKALLGEESEEWKAMEKWDGGKWSLLLKLTKQYQTVN